MAQIDVILQMNHPVVGPDKHSTSTSALRKLIRNEYISQHS